MLGTVLPSLINGISSRATPTTTATATVCAISGGGRRGRREGGGKIVENDDENGTDAIRTLCGLTGRFAAEERHDTARFRDKLSASGLRDLGAIGREAEVVLAEAFFDWGSGRT